MKWEAWKKSNRKEFVKAYKYLRLKNPRMEKLIENSLWLLVAIKMGFCCDVNGNMIQTTPEQKKISRP